MSTFSRLLKRFPAQQFAQSMQITLSWKLGDNITPTVQFGEHVFCLKLFWQPLSTKHIQPQLNWEPRALLDWSSLPLLCFRFHGPPGATFPILFESVSPSSINARCKVIGTARLQEKFAKVLVHWRIAMPSLLPPYQTSSDCADTLIKCCWPPTV